MKVYLVTTVAGCLVGIEKCRAFIVLPAQEAAFLKEYAGCILQSGCCLAALPPVTISTYSKGL